MSSNTKAQTQAAPETAGKTAPSSTDFTFHYINSSQFGATTYTSKASEESKIDARFFDFFPNRKKDETKEGTGSREGGGTQAVYDLNGKCQVRNV